MTRKPIDWPSVLAHRTAYIAYVTTPRMCADPDCGITFLPTPSGRLRHQQMVGHKPRERRDEMALICDNGSRPDRSAPTSQVVEHLGRGLTPEEGALVTDRTREPASPPLFRDGQS